VVWLVDVKGIGVKRKNDYTRIPPQIFGSKLRHPQTKVANPVQVLGGLNYLI